MQAPFRTRLFFLILMGVTVGHATGAPDRPNIIYILADDLGYADTGFMGGKDIQTPALDKLARGGAILTSLYGQPMCSPTRAALLTGRYPSRTGVYRVVRPRAPWGLGLRERTLAEALREADYQTVVVGKWHLGEFEADYLPTRRGFDLQYGPWFGGVDYFTHERDGIPDWYRNDKPCDDQGYTTHLFAKEACRVIQASRPEKPFFLYFAPNAVHDPYQVPDSYLPPFAHLPEQRQRYAAVLAALDEAVGQMMDALRDKGIIERTLVVFSSDNGGIGAGSNGSLRGNKATVYEGGVRLCGFATWPGRIPAGITIDEPVHVVDWYPTLIKLAGGTVEQKLPIDGRDIWPVLTAGAKSPHPEIPLFGIQEGTAALRVGDWKLVRQKTKDELYNIRTDLAERQDVAKQEPARRKELAARLDHLQAAAVKPRDAKLPLEFRRQAPKGTASE